MMFLPHQTSATHRSKPVASRQPPSAAPGQHPWEVYYRFYHKLDAVAKGTTRQWQHPSGRSNLQRTKICKNMLHATRMFCGLNEANSACIKISEDIYDIWRVSCRFCRTKSTKNRIQWKLLASFSDIPCEAMAMTVSPHARGEICVVMMLQLAVPRLEFNALKLRQTKQADSGTGCCSPSWFSFPNAVVGKHQYDVIWLKWWCDSNMMMWWYDMTWNDLIWYDMWCISQVPFAWTPSSVPERCLGTWWWVPTTSRSVDRGYPKPSKWGIPQVARGEMNGE